MATEPLGNILKSTFKNSEYICVACQATSTMLNNLMGQKTQLIFALKKILHSKGMTYRHLAEKLNIGHSHLRRIFSKEKLNLERLDEICLALDITLKDICAAMEEEPKVSGIFNLEQENALAKNQELFGLFYILASGLNVDEVMARHHFEIKSLEAYLLQLDKLGLIKLYANNRLKCLYGTDIKWIENGPLETKFFEQARKEFWSASFNGPFERNTYHYSKLSQNSLELVHRKFQKLQQEISQMSEEDKSLYPRQDLVDMFYIYAYRSFVPSSIAFLKRDFSFESHRNNNRLSSLEKDNLH